MIPRLSLAALLAATAWPALAQEEPAPEGTAEAQAETEEAQADAAQSQGGTGALVNGEGAPLGNVTVSVTPSGVTLVVVQAEGFPEGVFGVHVHMVGACEGPTFESAGEHIADGRDHGIMSANGPHPGDLPNAHVQSDGVIAMEAFAIGLGSDPLFDEDGSALMVHSNSDDYTTQPGGDSGDRLACAVIQAGGDAGAAREAAEGSEAVEAQDGEAQDGGASN